jgi:hypothetical protein
VPPAHGRCFPCSPPRLVLSIADLSQPVARSLCPCTRLHLVLSEDFGAKKQNRGVIKNQNEILNKT